MIRFILIFLVALVLLFGLELTYPIQNALVIPWTGLLAHISAALIHLFDPHVIAEGKVLLDSKTGTGVAIEAGCNGVEACLILAAALLAFPSPWLSKVIGISVGFIAIQALNIVRIITLFYLVSWNKAVFEFAHLYLWQALIMLDVLVVWLLWVRWVSKQEARKEARI